MDTDIATLLERLRGLEDELELRLQTHRETLRYKIRNRRAIFEKDVEEQHRRLRKGVVAYLRSSRLVDIFVLAPVTYGLLIPFALLDICIAVFQLVCFGAWGVPRVRRSDYIVIDRHRLGYLNGIEKINCVYCGYANGLIALVREVGSRTEAYWCPIKHALRTAAPHDRYREFLEYGDGPGFVAGAETYRAAVRGQKSEAHQASAPLTDVSGRT